MKRIVALFAVLFFTFNTIETKASHFAAMDIWYEYMSPLTYKVHVQCYLDCCQSCATYYVGGFCYGSAATGSTSLTITDADTIGANDPLQDAILDQLCAGTPNYCVSPASVYPAFRYRHFIKIITLPSVQPDWSFGASDGARNSTIGNGFANQQISVEATLNNVVRPINSSPQLTVKPIPYVCFNTPQVYQNGPDDPDLDSVVFEWNTPRGGGCAVQTALAFAPATNTLTSPFPVASTGPFLLNPLSGEVSFTPNTQGVYVMGFTATDYDKITGAKLGSSMRDVQVVVLQCNGLPPIADSICCVNGAIDNVVNGQHVMTVCPGTTMSFDSYGYTGSQFSNLISYGNNSTLLNSTYTTNPPNGGTNSVTGSFTWTPTNNDYGLHTLILSYVDSTCIPGQAVVLKAYQTIIINVLPGVSAGGPYNYCPGGEPLMLTGSGPVGTTTWNWSVLPGQGNLNPNFIGNNNDTIFATPNGTVDIVLEGLPIVSGCPNKDTVTLNVFSALQISAGPDRDVCANDPVVITATSNRAPINVNNFSVNQLWSPKTFMTSGFYSLTPSLTPLASETYYLTVIDAFGCKAKDTVNINVVGIRPIINAYPERDILCIGEPVKLYSNASAQPCGISANACTGPVNDIIVGNGIVNNSNFSPFIRDFNSAYRAQYLIRADELTAAGMSVGNIKGLKLSVLNSASSDSLLGFKIKIGCTAESSLNTNTGFALGLTTVFSANSFSPTLGNNVFNFPGSAQYFWDGKSNIIVEFCYNLPQGSGSTTSTVASKITSFNSSLVDQSFNGSGCNIINSGFNIAASSLRPNFKFIHCNTNTFNYVWAPANAFNNPTLENPNVKPGFIQSNTTFTVLVKSGTTGLCDGSKTVNVAVDLSGAVNPTALPNHICAPGLVTLNAVPLPGTQPPLFACGEENAIPNGVPSSITIGSGTGTNSMPFNLANGSKTQWLILASELSAAGLTQGLISQLSVDVATKASNLPYSDLNINLSCTKDNVLNSFINIGNNKNVFNDPNYSTTAGWNNFVFNKGDFLWDGVSNIVVEMCYANYSGFNPDYLNSTQLTYYACYGEVTYNGVGCDLGSASSGFATTTYYRPNTIFRNTPVANKLFQYVWTPPLYVYDTTKAQTLAYVLNSKTYTVSLVNKTGCLISDTVNVSLETHDVTVSPTEISKCAKDGVQITAFGTGSGKLPTYQWLPNISYKLEADTAIISTSPLPITYLVIRTDEFGCKDTATSKINVWPDPNVTILNGDTLLVPYNTNINLVANGASLYSWTPTWGLSNSNSNSVSLSPKSDALYYVYGIDTNGCFNYDTIYIKIDNTNPVFLPTAFSPNGDGYNDRFKIQNYKFEKIQEFRIFNRLGEEIYSANDNNGWDGKYRGKVTDMDTYMYIIRLAYPDGSVKVYKGDVLLMQ